MLTIEEIKKALDTGNAVGLECVDVDMYCRTDSAFKNEREVIARSSLVITSIIGQGDFKALMISDCRYCIPENDLKHFRIKRPIPTFDDLIDVAVKAVKNRVLFTMSIGDNKRKGRYLNYAVNGNSPTESFYESDDDYQACIDFINSLYTETFVIESDSDIERINVGACIELLNGNKDSVLYKSTYRGLPMLQFSDNKHWGSLGIFILKGATVTQSRGEK